MSYRIRPLVQAQITAPLGVAIPLGDMRTFFTAPVYIWYIEGAKEKILVDAGVEAPGPDGLVHGFPIKGGGEKGLLEALSAVGVKPEDIDILILTHLHFDHIACATLFKNAKIYVQKREWKFAFDPIPTARAVYDRKLFEPLEKMDLIIVDGDYEVLEGIKLVLLPGHTKGLQGVAVSTEKGTALLASDHFYTYFNLNPATEKATDLTGAEVKVTPRPDLPFMPPAIHVDLTEWFDSSWKALKTASKRDLIYPGHEPALANKILP